MLVVDVACSWLNSAYYYQPVSTEHPLWLSNMAADGDDNIFVYMGDEQEVPDGVTHAIIDPSVKTVRRMAFYQRRQLVSVIFHDGVEIIEAFAFHGCVSLPRIKLLGVREIGDGAFCVCYALSDVEFGNRLETVGVQAFYGCNRLRSIKMPSVRVVQGQALGHCGQLTDVEFGIDLETICFNSFIYCYRLQRIAIPLNDNIFPIARSDQRYNQFNNCSKLTTVDIVGAEGIHNTISSLLMQSWKNEINEEIGRINQELPSIRGIEKTNAIQQWIRSVINGVEHYKAEHNRLLKEHMTLLELAVWKTKLDAEDDDNSTLEAQSKKAKIDTDYVRKEKRITSGADIVIKNVLPFLRMA